MSHEGTRAPESPFAPTLRLADNRVAAPIAPAYSVVAAGPAAPGHPRLSTLSTRTGDLGHPVATAIENSCRVRMTALDHQPPFDQQSWSMVVYTISSSASPAAGIVVAP
jgi:hypothetical protein